MATSELTNFSSTKTYTMFISSNGEVSGSNNNGTYQINWDDVLPRKYSAYKMGFTFQTGGGKYQDGMYATFIGGTLGTTLTVTSMTANSQPILINQLIQNTVLTTGASYIVTQLTGTTGGIGTYTISTSQTIASSSFNTSYVFNGGKVVMNTLGKTFSFDTASKSVSHILGYIQRDVQSTTSNSNSLAAFYLQSPPKTINRPNQNLITISIYNITNGILLTDTSQFTPTALLPDMTPWNMILEFTPIEDSKILL